MSSHAHQLLATFDTLDPKERREVAAEILRRSMGEGELTDDALTELGADLFHSYDDEESPRAQGESR